MHREPILGLLRAHAARRLDEPEGAMTEDGLRFIAAHPDVLLRTCLEGHLTGSAWIVNAERTRTLLTHHRKLGKWLQLGGHADGDPDLRAVALREAEEESGLARLRLVSPAIFDFDRHRIPARGGEPAHWHYDVRFMIEADPADPLVVTNESKALAWVELAAVGGLNPGESIARMVRKTALL